MILERFGTPRIAADAFVAETAVVIGDVEIGSEASVWYGAVLRGDKGRITVAQRANVQDNCVVHAGPGGPGEDTLIGEGTTVGHGAIVHSCTVGRHCLVGMGAIILSRALIGDRCIIGAGAVIMEDAVIPEGSLVVGVPGKVVKQLSPEQLKYPEKACEEYIELTRQYLQLQGRLER